MEKLRIEREYKAGLAQVWEAITDQQSLNKWLMGGSFKAEQGEEFTFTERNLTFRGRVLEVMTGCKISYLWISRRDEDDPESGVPSVVTWTLKPTESGGTHVLMEHEMLEAAEPVVTIEAAVNWSYAIHCSLSSFLSGQHRQPVPIVFVPIEEELEPVLKRAGFREVEEVKS